MPLSVFAQQLTSLEQQCISKPPYFGYTFDQKEIEGLLTQLLPLHSDWVEYSKKLEKKVIILIIKINVGLTYVVQIYWA